MLTTAKQRSRLRLFGAVWLFLAPIIFVAASISTVRSDAFYRVQLGAFSLVAIASAFLGVAALFCARWAASGLRVLSWLGAIYFFGSAVLLFFQALMPGSRAEFRTTVLALPMIAPFGLPFLFLARGLADIVRSQRTESLRQG